MPGLSPACSSASASSAAAVVRKTRASCETLRTCTQPFSGQIFILTRLMRVLSGSYHSKVVAYRTPFRNNLAPFQLGLVCPFTREKVATPTFVVGASTCYLACLLAVLYQVRDE